MSRVQIKAGAEYDLPTSGELRTVKDELISRFSLEYRERYRGIKLMRIPEIIVRATANGSLTIYNPLISPGPPSGFVWRIARATVTSSGTDNGGLSTPAPSTPVVPGSTNAQQNANPYPVSVVITGGTITAVFVNGVQVGATAGTYTVPAAGSISITYSVAPTWQWTYGGLGSTFVTGGPVQFYVTSDGTIQQRNVWDTSQQLGVSWFPSSRGAFLNAGEDLVAVVPAAINGNTYILTGQIVSVPAEMIGKLI